MRRRMLQGDAVGQSNPLMVELVRKAIHNELARPVWGESQSVYERRLAQAAIEAMRQPTENMVSAMKAAPGAFNDLALMGMAWEAGVEAALKRDLKDEMWVVA